MKKEKKQQKSTWIHWLDMIYLLSTFFAPESFSHIFFFMSLSNQNNKCFGCVLLAESLFRRHNMKEKKVKLILESSEWHFFSLSSFWRRTHFVKQVLDLGIDKVALVSVLNSTSSELLSCSRKSRMKSSHSFNCSKSNSIATEVTQFQSPDAMLLNRKKLLCHPVNFFLGCQLIKMRRIFHITSASNTLTKNERFLYSIKSLHGAFSFFPLNFSCRLQLLISSLDNGWNMIDEFTLQITNYSWNDNERILKIGLIPLRPCCRNWLRTCERRF